MVKRIYVKKADEIDFTSLALCKELNDVFALNLKSVKKLVRYDIEDIDEKIYDNLKGLIFGNGVDEIIIDGEKAFQDEVKGKKVLQIQLLDGQYDLRADGIANCLQIYTFDKLNVKSADVYVFDGINEKDFEKVKKYLFNPVDSEISPKYEYKTLERKPHDMGQMRIEIEGFIDLDDKGLEKYFNDEGFAMTIHDLKVVQEYFKSIKRNPTITEIKVIDTYWSDHCRHTTFLTELKDIQIVSKNENIKKTFNEYLDLHKKLFKDRNDKYVCLMDLATIAARFLRKEGILKNQEISEEINACSVRAKIDNDGVLEDWLIMFKNETHNHPTEIEPYGGAGTCLGGAIRDPLSGRSFVYQAMRITAAGNILEDVDKTLPNKLPQRTLSKTAMRGYSSYGNQIGIASGQLNELFHNRFRAKRMEAGYVIGASKEENVVRKVPKKGDYILLVGGDTGRDGIGGATGSSKTQTVESFDEAGAEVQKGNAAEERKLIRLYDNPIASKMIIRSNDFGAGGVSVAIGELADGLDIYLERVPVKYQLNATEIAISESQERMAVVIEPENVDEFIKIAKGENLKITHVATVTDLDKMRLFYNDDLVVDLDRSFLNTNGAKLSQEVKVQAKTTDYFTKACGRALNYSKSSLENAIAFEVRKINNCSQKGIANNFDSSVGGLTVFAPYGGKSQNSPTMVMASKPPVSGFTHTVTCSSYGIYPDLMIQSPYVGAMHSVIASISKLIASGVSYGSIFMSYQEFFKRLGKDKTRWGEPFEALLGVFKAQMELGLGSIGGKDSMSGSYENIDVPPTLISFAMGTTTDDNIVSSAFKPNGKLYIVDIKRDEFGNVDFKDLKVKYLDIEKQIKDKNILYSTVVESNLATALVGAFAGNKVGADLNISIKELFTNKVGDIVLVAKDELKGDKYRYIGILNSTYTLKIEGQTVCLEKVEKSYMEKLDSLYPQTIKSNEKVKTLSFEKAFEIRKSAKVKPNVLVPIFLGTIGEKELVKSFKNAGANVTEFVFKNITSNDIKESLVSLENEIKSAQIFAFSDSLTCGDELDGTSKFATTILSNPKIKEALQYLLLKNDGLILGLGGGMEALLKLGFILPQNAYGAMAQNSISKFVSAYSNIRVSANYSPWMSSFNIGENFMVPVSTGKGRFVTDKASYDMLISNAQIAAQFVDDDNNATLSVPQNPTGSMYAVESLTSVDGKVLAKLGHVERYQKGLYQNLEGNFDMNIFKNGVNYFE